MILRHPVKLRQGPEPSLPARAAQEIRYRAHSGTGLEPWKFSAYGRIRSYLHRILDHGNPIGWIPGFPLFILMGIFVGWKNTRGSLNEQGFVDLIFDDKNPAFVLGQKIEGGIHPDIEVANLTVNDRHAVIARTADGALSIIDLGSKNGTWIWKNGHWERLAPLWAYRLEAGKHIALGWVEPQSGQWMLDHQNAVLLTLHAGADPQVWRLVSRNQGTAFPQLPPSMNSNSPDSSVKTPAFSRAHEDLLRLAAELEKDGQFEKAHRDFERAIQGAIKDLEELQPGRREKRRSAMRELANAELMLAEFLKRREQWGQAGTHYEAAEPIYGEVNLEHWAQGHAYLSYLREAETAELNGNIFTAAVYFERAGGMAPFTRELDFMGQDWGPDREAILCLARAALYYKDLGPGKHGNFEKVLQKLEKIPEHESIQPYQEWATDLRKIIFELTAALPRSNFGPAELKKLIKKNFGR